MIVELGSRRHDVTLRGLVVGRVDATVGSSDAVADRAQVQFEEGAVAVELVGSAGRSTGLLQVLSAACAGPLGCEVGTTGELVDAVAAGASMVSVVEPGLASELCTHLLAGTPPADPGADPSEERGHGPRKLVAAVSSEVLQALEREATTRGATLARERLVLDGGVDRADGRAEAIARLHETSRLVSAGFPVGFTPGAELDADAAAACTVALRCGARILRTGRVRSARRAADMVAALCIEHAYARRPGAA